MNYQLDYAVLKTLGLISRYLSAPHKNWAIRVEPRAGSATAATQWDLGADPATRVDLPRHRPRDITPLTAEEARRLLKAAEGAPHEAFYHLALDTGARQAEILALTWDDVLFGEAPEVFYNKALQDNYGELRVKTTKTPKGRRRVPITLLTAAKLEAARPEGAGTDDQVFPRRRGNLGYTWPTNFRKKCWGPVKAKAGLPKARLHDLRHTCATLLLLANVHPKVVSERLGHANIEITLNT
jgi:integrase